MRIVNMCRESRNEYAFQSRRNQYNFSKRFHVLTQSLKIVNRVTIYGTKKEKKNVTHRILS